MLEQERPAPIWRKSSASEEDECVEVAVVPAAVLARDSEDPAGHRLSFSHAAWRDFVSALRSGELDGPG